MELDKCPRCASINNSLRLIATITQGEVMRKMLRHLKRSPALPPLAAAHADQTVLAWASP